MKRKVLQLALLATLLWGGSMQTRADGFAVLTVTMNDETVYYQVTDIRKITFDYSNMVLHLTNGETEELPLSVVNEITVGDGSAGIAMFGSDKTGLKLKDGMLSLNLTNGGTVTIYDTAGKTIRSLQAKAGQNTISLNQLPKGVYIVRVNGASQKFLNR